MEAESIRRNFQEKMSAVMRRVEEARKNAVTREEAHHHSGQYASVDTRDLSGKELEKKMWECAPHEVAFESLAEFAACLRDIAPRENADEIIAHENAHMNAAEMHKIPCIYKLAFVKDPYSDGVLPYVVYWKPSGMSVQEYEAIDEKITSAPDVLTDSDEEALRKMREKR